jgi:quercetin dioxygenase-like cupin family protein/heme-degrading monooxygenase HmoA
MNDHLARGSQAFRPEALPSRQRGGGATTTPLVTAARGATSFLNGITAFDGGAAIAHHTHNVAESVMVIEGSAVVDIDGVDIPLKQFDTTFVPANVPHHFTNASPTEAMKIFWTYGSINATRTILPDQEPGRVDDESHPDGTRSAFVPVNEVATLRIRAGHASQFEAAVQEAIPLFQDAVGARTMLLERSEEDPLAYRLVVGWNTLADHVRGFRQSADFARWRELIGDHLEEPPVAEHFRHVLTGF